MSKSKFVDQKKGMCTSKSYWTRAASRVSFCQPRMDSDMILDILLLTKRRRCVSLQAEGATEGREAPWAVRSRRRKPGFQCTLRIQPTRHKLIGGLRLMKFNVYFFLLILFGFLQCIYLGGLHLNAAWSCGSVNEIRFQIQIIPV